MRIFAREKRTSGKTKKVDVMSYIKVVGRPISRTLVHSFAGGVNTRNDESVLPISTAKIAITLNSRAERLRVAKAFYRQACRRNASGNFV